jgi:hypothetical protein
VLPMLSVGKTQSARMWVYGERYVEHRV